MLSVRRQRKATETGADAPDQAVAFFCTAAQPSHPKRAICVQAENEQLRKQAQSLLIRQQLLEDIADELGIKRRKLRTYN